MNPTSTWTPTASRTDTVSPGRTGTGAHDRATVVRLDERTVGAESRRPGAHATHHVDLGDRGGGAVSVPMVICILAIVVVAGLTVDGVRAAQGIARADALAEEAARAAGQALDPVALSAGTAVIAPDAAADAARAYLATAGGPPVPAAAANGTPSARVSGAEVSGARVSGAESAGAEVTGAVTVVSPDRVRVEVTVRQPALLLGLIGQQVLTSTGTAEAVLVPVLPGDVP
jgi:hypothetical protein